MRGMSLGPIFCEAKMNYNPSCIFCYNFFRIFFLITIFRMIYDYNSGRREGTLRGARREGSDRLSGKPVQLV